MDEDAHAAATRTKGADEAADARRALLETALLATGLADRTAFRRVYQMTSAKLFGICLRICGERQAAEDVLQEVYLIIWRRAPSFEPGRSSPVTWLATIARNRAIDWRRTNRRPPPDPMPDYTREPAREPVDGTVSAEAAMMGDQQADRLQACLAELEERARQAICSAFLDGMTYSELARRDATPLPTMKSMIRRALLRLRKCMIHDA